MRRSSTSPVPSRASRRAGRTSTRCWPATSRTARTAETLPALTQRERDVLRLLADGHSNEEIGKRLYISSETVRTHVRKAMQKLDADTRTQGVATALRQSLIS